MAYCEYCGSALTNGEQFCAGCGAPVPITQTDETVTSNQAETSAETLDGGFFGSEDAAAAAAFGASLLGSLLRGTMRRPPMPPTGMFHGHGSPGHRGGFGGGFGGPGGPGRGGPRGGFGGPGGGRRGGPR